MGIIVYIEFFISRRAVITSTGFVFPVAFWISGSYTIMSIGGRPSG